MTKLKVLLMQPPLVKYKDQPVSLIRKSCCWAQAETAILPHELFTIGSTIVELVDVTIYDPTLLPHDLDTITRVLTNAKPDYIITHYCIFDERERPFIELLKQLNIKTILISSPIYYAQEIRDRFPFIELAVDRDPEVTIYNYFRTQLRLTTKPDLTFTDLPPIDWQLFFNPKLLGCYNIVYEISRGCCYNCQFCLLGTLPYKWRPPEIVINDLYRLSQLREVRWVEFECSQITTDLNWIKHFCALKKQFKLDFQFNTSVKANEITDEKIKLLKDAGQIASYMGIDSINPQVMKELGKKITITHIQNAIAILKKYNMDLCCSTMFNLGENDNDVNEMLAILETIKLPRTRSGIVNVYKNTPLWYKHKDVLVSRPADPNGSYNDQLLTLPDWRNALKRQEYFKEKIELIYSKQFKGMSLRDIVDNKRIRIEFKGYDNPKDVRGK